MPPSLRPQNSPFSYWQSYTHCENNQWTLRASNGRDIESTVTLEPRTSTQCWKYHTSPAQCADHENHIYCAPTLGRLEKYNRLRTLRIENIDYNMNHFTKHTFKN